MDRNHRLGSRIGGLFAGMAFGPGVASAQVDVERARKNMEQAARDILNMLGKKRESQAMIAKMGQADQMAAMSAALELFRKCAGPGR